MSTPAGDERTTIILQKRYNRLGCFVCKARTHTHLSCPQRPCYLCKKKGHLSSDCPHRLKPGAHAATLKALLAARDKRGRVGHFLRSREIDPSPTTVHPSLLYFRNPQFDCRAALGLRRYHAKRVTAAEWHPSGRYVVSGDKSGAVKVWNLGEGVEGGWFEADKVPRVQPGMSYLHHCNVTGFVFSEWEEGVVYSGASDGCVCESRVEFVGTECVGGRTVVLNLNPDGWNGESSFKMVYGMEMDVRRGCLYVGDSKGRILRRDPREDGGKVSEIEARFHKDKVTSIHVNPVRGDLIATASNDKKVCLWDARKMVPGHQLGVYEHGRVASSAYFAPNGGGKLLTTSMDNKIQIWDDVHGFVGNVNEREDAQPSVIIHSHNFHRHLNAFKAVWDPKDWKDDLFVCGRFLGDAYYEHGDESASAAVLHPIDLFSAKAGSVVHSLVDYSLELICPTNKFSPTANFILTAASGDLIIWSPPKPGSQVKDGPVARGRGTLPDDNDSSDEDLDPHERKRRLKPGPVVRKRRNRASTRRRNVS